MVSYPLLSKQQQATLPALLKPAISIPTLFEDSTHHLWRCETQQGAMVLKVCNKKSIEKSSFWQAMNHLFNASFPQSLADMSLIYADIARYSPLLIPQCIATESAQFILASTLAGQAIIDADINNEMVEKLAEHISQLHQQTNIKWGPMPRPEFSASQWPARLSASLQMLVEQSDVKIPELIVKQALEQIALISVTEFVPTMIDLRWDQFLQQNGKLSALVDLDAFVFAPRELELVLLEFILDPAQMKLFIAKYQQTYTLPDLSLIRQPYRLLLFLMNVLGETDLNRWMNAPILLSYNPA